MAPFVATAPVLPRPACPADTGAHAEALHHATAVKRRGTAGISARGCGVREREDRQMPHKETKPKAVTKTAPAAKTTPAAVVVNDTGRGLEIEVVANNADDLKSTLG